jgi:hypothetical protein
LDQVKELQLNSNLEAVSSTVIFFQHHLGQKVLIFYSFDVKHCHLHTFFFQISALVVQTEESLGQKTKELVEKAHADDWVTAVTKEVVLELRIFNLMFDLVQKVICSRESEDTQ